MSSSSRPSSYSGSIFDWSAMDSDQNGSILDLIIPRPTWVEGLQAGDFAYDCFGRLLKVVNVFARGVNRSGAPYSCVNLDAGDGSTISASYTAGHLLRSLPLCNALTSAELDEIEAGMLDRCCNRAAFYVGQNAVVDLEFIGR